MAFITQDYFDSQLDVPIHLPCTTLEASAVIVVASIGISATTPITATITWLQFRMLNGTGNAYLSCFLNFNPQQDPSTQSPIETITINGSSGSNACSNTLDSAQFQERDTQDPLVLTVAGTGAGTYSWVAYCDATSSAQLMVNGSARLNLSPGT